MGETNKQNLKENLKITVGSDIDKQGQLQKQDPSVFQQEPKSSIKVYLKARKTLDGDIMIADHNRLDICISPKKMKVIVFAKSGDFSDMVYAAQNRFFEFLLKKGLIEPGSVKGTNVYGGFEANMLQPDDDLPIDQIVILNVKKWMDEEKPAMDFEIEYEKKWEEYLTEPDDDETTELGEVPQEEEKGNMNRWGLDRRFMGTWW